MSTQVISRFLRKGGKLDGILDPYPLKGSTDSISLLLEQYRIPSELRSGWSSVRISFPFRDSSHLEVELPLDEEASSLTFPGVFPNKKNQYVNNRISGKFNRIVPVSSRPHILDNLVTPAAVFDVVDEMIDTRTRHIRFGSLLCLNVWVDIHLVEDEVVRCRMHVEELLNHADVDTCFVTPQVQVIQDEHDQNMILVIREPKFSRLALFYKL